MNDIKLFLCSNKEVLWSAVAAVSGWFAKVIYEKYTLKYKLKVEYGFEQKKALKSEIAKNRTSLLNAVEEFNHRLWNLSQYFDKVKLNASKENWFKEDQEYLNSFIYKYLKVIYYTIKTEKDTTTIDLKNADKVDLLYLKYVKTIKDFFTDKDLEKIDNTSSNRVIHFRKHELETFADYLAENNQSLKYKPFEKTLETNYAELEKVVNYFSKIENKIDDPVFNNLKCFHLLILCFLNQFGNDYQKTPKEKMKRIIAIYKDLDNKEKLFIFIKKSKLDKEFKKIIKLMK